MTVYCVYHHADMDGKCSGAIVRQRHPDCVLVPMDYKDEFPECLKGVGGDTIYIVDFSFDPEVMELLARNNRVIWLDHHKSAIEKARRTFPGLQRTDVAGCELTWEYLNTAVKPPAAVTLIGSYDSWRWVRESEAVQDNVLAFMAGCEQYPLWPDDPRWARLLSKAFDAHLDLLQEGRVIRRYVAEQDLRMCKAAAYMDDDGWLVCNTNRASKTVFDAFIKERGYQPKGIRTWYRCCSGEIKVSLRSDDPQVDCSVLASLHGGGGHRGAAGYTLPAITPELLGNQKLNG